MIIRRSFGFCASHIVRNCTSKRCATSLHGHNYRVEVFIGADSLDNGGMVLDFGLFKNQIADFIDGLDHAHHFWEKESFEFVDFIQKNSARYVKLSRNPSAENYALLLLFFIDKILGAMEFGNAEGEVFVQSVRVHETDHGYAQAFRDDLKNPKLMEGIDLFSVDFSAQILSEWKDSQMLHRLKNYYNSLEKEQIKPFVNPSPLYQI